MSVLLEVLDLVRRAAGAGRPLVVFDLDSTLLSTQQRNHAILLEFAADPRVPPSLAGVIGKMAAPDMGWNIMDDLRQRGFSEADTLRRLRRFWLERFFSDDYLRHDEPLPGAVEYVCDLFGAGGIVCYLTGRDEPKMGRGTRDSLRDRGFPFGHERVHLFLKPRFEDSDYAFKQTAIEEISRLGEVMAAFENEPGNANLFAERFPTARVVLLETVHSPDPPPLAPSVIRVKDFRR